MKLVIDEHDDGVGANSELFRWAGSRASRQLPDFAAAGLQQAVAQSEELSPHSFLAPSLGESVNAIPNGADRCVLER